MRVLIACEYSGKVREAFRALGHDAWTGARHIKASQMQWPPSGAKNSPK